MTQDAPFVDEPSVDVILRFERGERLLHWAIALPFMVCYSSAAVLFFYYNPEPTRAYRAVFAWTHRISGAALIVLPFLAMVSHPQTVKTHLKNIGTAWIWSYDDFKWLLMMGLAAVSKRFTLPEADKFNAAEKLNFMMVMTSSPLFIVSGLVIWLPHDAAFYPWMAHVILAGIVTPLMFGHIFMATANPSTRVGLPGMVTGHVNKHWAKHHYPRWYRDNFEKRRRAHTRSAELQLLQRSVETPHPKATPDDEHPGG